VTGCHQLPAQGQYRRGSADANALGFAAIRANEGGPDRYGLLEGGAVGVSVDLATLKCLGW
jgi:hypothetical protein